MARERIQEWISSWIQGSWFGNSHFHSTEGSVTRSPAHCSNLKCLLREKRTWCCHRGTFTQHWNVNWRDTWLSCHVEFDEEGWNLNTIRRCPLVTHFFATTSLTFVFEQSIATWLEVSGRGISPDSSEGKSRLLTPTNNNTTSAAQNRMLEQGCETKTSKLWILK